MQLRKDGFLCLEDRKREKLKPAKREKRRELGAWRSVGTY